MNRRPPRPDFSYISRRSRPTAPRSDPPVENSIKQTRQDGNASLILRRSSPDGFTPTSAATSTANAGRLNLDRRSSGSASVPAAGGSPKRGPHVTAASHLFEAPDFGSVRHLSAESPVARLNARQAGIGSLVVSGAQSAVWEDSSLTTGTENVHGEKAGSVVMTPGNRPLVGFHGGSALITLRHVQRLRRALFIAKDVPLVASVFGGAAVALLPQNSNERVVLYISRIGELLELRAEYVMTSNDSDTWAEFGFSMTMPVNFRPARH